MMFKLCCTQLQSMFRRAFEPCSRAVWERSWVNILAYYKELLSGNNHEYAGSEFYQRISIFHPCMILAPDSFAIEAKFLGETKINL